MENHMRTRTSFTLAVLIRLALICAGAAYMSLRVAAQETDAPPPAPATQTVPQAPSQTPGKKAPGDDAATIEDDPTIAPDPKQSADNNISFPADI
jgi:hypothetical protein